MKAPLASVALDDKYTSLSGRTFLSGVQALVRLPILQRAADAARGLNTAGFISGYRGSPLGNYDLALWSAQDLLEQSQIRFQPGLNEELAATACWGTQHAMLMPGPRHDGVFAIWYGKGPGVDRAGDALKHGNMAGSSPNGGVLVLAGDDHGSKSSTLAHQSDQALIAALIPVLHPPTLRDYLRLGLAGWAMSRFAGTWAAMKCVTETVESSGTIDFEMGDAHFETPEMEPEFAAFRAQSPRLQTRWEEEAVVRWRLRAATAFARCNRIDRPLWTPRRRRLALIAVGKSCADTLQAFADLGIDRKAGEALGVGLYNVCMPWPLDAESLRAFASGYDETLIIEEKRGLVEPQAAQALYNLAPALRPRLVGKCDLDGAQLLPDYGELSPRLIRRAVLARLAAAGPVDESLRARAEQLDAREADLIAAIRPVAPRTPAFCSGCPHNRSTATPEGSISLAGIGCHTIAIGMPDRPTLRPTQMGGEGANWIGMAPFVSTRHVFQNLGDGTYFHSGSLAVRAAAVAARVNVTFKILFNDAVAMTGGQPLEGKLTAPRIARQLKAEGVDRIVIVTDEPEKHRSRRGIPCDVEVRHRADLMSIEGEMREQSGVTAIIYDQACAAEKRRRRKRGAWPDPPKRYFINADVCEGCGDCGRVSNCVSLLPDETPFGVKRKIDQSSCNKDYSCADGFCPSFVTVLGGAVRAAGSEQRASVDDFLAALPEPPSAPLDRSYNILIAGVGGSGVVTVGALIGMAAHLEGKACSLLDLTGLSQKNGAVFSHVRLAPTQDELTVARIGIGAADALIGCDLVASAAPEAAGACDRARTGAVVNTRVAPVAALQQDAHLDLSTNSYFDVLNASTRIGADDRIDAAEAAEKLFGNTIFANVFLLGAAYQKGLVPLGADAIERAIDLNGTARAQNRLAFRWGRIAFAAPDALSKTTAAPEAPQADTPPRTFEAIVSHRERHLAAYQSEAYARTFRAFVDRIASREEAIAPGRRDLSTAAATGLCKLMAYKDEYEVARLLADPRFRRMLATQFEGAYRLRFNLAPPLLFARKDRSTGLPRKHEFGGWMLGVMAVLAKLKLLRGGPFDIFGWTAERRAERALVGEYRRALEEAMEILSPSTYGCAIEIARLPDIVRGYGPVKGASIERYRKQLTELTSRLRSDAL